MNLYVPDLLNILKKNTFGQNLKKIADMLHEKVYDHHPALSETLRHEQERLESKIILLLGKGM